MRVRLKPILIAISLTLLSAGAAAPQEAPPRTLTVTAEGRVAAAPDMARIAIGVSAQRPTADEALSQMSAAAEAVLARLAAAGIPERDLQTGQLSLHPVYGSSTLSSPAKITAFEALSSIDVRVRDLAILGPVLDAVVEDGANRLDGLRFDIAEPEPLLDEARRAAVANAMARAGILAEAAGVTLGPVLGLTEGQDIGPQPMAMEMRMMADAASVPLAEGEVNLAARVTMVFALE